MEVKSGLEKESGQWCKGLCRVWLSNLLVNQELQLTDPLTAGGDTFWSRTQPKMEQLLSEVEGLLPGLVCFPSLAVLVERCLWHGTKSTKSSKSENLQVLHLVSSKQVT